MFVDYLTCINLFKFFRSVVCFFIPVPAIIEQKVTFLYASGSQLTATLPERTNTLLKIIDSSKFARLTLYIQLNQNLNFVCATIPVYGKENNVRFLNF